MNFSIILLNTLTFFALLNPFGNVPLFIGMTEDMDKATRNKILNIVIITALLITIIFSLVGDFLMTKFFQIGIEELRMAGGIILIIIGIKNIIFSETNTESDSKPKDMSHHIRQAIIPMAFPMLVGPGLLTATLIARVKDGLLVTCLCIFITFIVMYFVFWLGNFIEKILNKLILFILARVMQIFILAIGFRIFFAGLFKSLELYGIIGPITEM